MPEFLWHIAEEIIKQLKQMFMLVYIYYEKSEYFTSCVLWQKPKEYFTYQVYLECTIESGTGIAKIL